MMIRNRKSDIKMFDKKLLFNPFNIQFFGDRHLTEKGLYFRNKSWMYLALLIIIIVIILIISQS